MSGKAAAEAWFPPEIAGAIEAADDTFRVPYDASLATAPDTFEPPGPWDTAHDNARKERRALRNLQKALNASKRFSVLAVFQALDAAGKDGAIREVFQGVNPAGLEVSGFKKPSAHETLHDFLWRTTEFLPRKGKIGLFNRSYYEEVLVVRVHPEFLDAQYGGHPPPAEDLWPARYRAIREHELHLACSNVLVLKFWLNVSLARQARRFMERLEHHEKRWKFSDVDVAEARLRPQYDEAVMHMFNETSRPWAPWYCIPADERWYARWQIARIIRQAMAALPLDYPAGQAFTDPEIEAYRKELTERLNGD